MSNITAGRDNGRRMPDSEFSDPIAADTKLYKGAMYGLDASGNATQLDSGSAAVARGEVVHTVDNTIAGGFGVAGDKNVRGRSGVFCFHISGSLDRTDIGNLVFALDDHTVSRDSDEGARPVMGELIDFTAGGQAVVKVGETGTRNAREFRMTIFVEDLVAANALRAGFVADRAFNITKIKSVLLGAALTAGNCTLTAKIAGAAVTGGVVTITQAGSAIGDVDTAAPTAATAVVENDFVELLVGGANTATGARAMVTISGVYAD